MSSVIGFIGLGLLGQAMALRLVKQGFTLVVWNREPERSIALADVGARVASSPQEVAELCSVICVCVINGRAVHDVMFGSQGITLASQMDRIVIDFSTVPPDETREIATAAVKHAIRWMDAPLSGGPAAALKGELTAMVGGCAEDMSATSQIFSAVANRVTHVGTVGKGQEMKVVNQALVGATFVMLAEVLALTRGLGLDPAIVPQCLEGGFGDSVALQRVWSIMAGDRFDPPTGRAAQLLKDLHHVDELRGKCGLTLPVVESAIGQYASYVQDQGGASRDTLSISRMYQQQ